MKLYVNGDSHAAAAEAVNAHSWAEDDSQYFYLGHAPHPDNMAVGWPRRLADTVKAALMCDAEAGSSNARILRTTRAWLKENHHRLSEALVIIQWSTWEREEWVDSAGRYIQVNASGIDHVPPELQERYKHFVVDTDWSAKTEQAHRDIWQLHTELRDLHVRHVFFNGNNHFQTITDRLDWGTSYIAPYDSTQTYDSLLKSNGFQTVHPKSWHFGKDAHSFWHRYVLQYIVKHKLI
jgi:hypothetical protein